MRPGILSAASSLPPPPNPAPVPLLRSVIVGLTRRPLDPADERAARALTPPDAPETARALALAAALSLRDRVALATEQQTAREDAPADAPPPAPAYPRAVATHVAAYLNASAALLGDPDVRLAADLGLALPAGTLADALERGMRATPIDLDYYAVLGARGRWLAAQHPRFARRVSFLAGPDVPGGAKQRLAYAAYHFAEWRRQPAQTAHRDALRCVIAATKWPPDAFGALSRGLDSGALAAWFSPRAFAKTCFASAADRAFAKTTLTHLGNGEGTARERIEVSGGLTAELLSELGPRILAARDARAAELVLRRAAGSRDVLLRKHPGLPPLAGALPAEAYADVVDYLLVHGDEGLGRAVIDEVLAASPHPVSRATTLAWAEDLAAAPRFAYAFGPGSPAAPGRARRFAWKLNPAALPDVLDPEFAVGADPLRHRHLIALLSARQRIEAAHPLSAPVFA